MWNARIVCPKCNQALVADSHRVGTCAVCGNGIEVRHLKTDFAGHPTACALDLERRIKAPPFAIV